MKRYGYALIGAGSQSIATSCQLPAVLRCPFFDIRMLMDTNPHVQDFAKGICEWTTDYKDVLNCPDIDIVDIAVPDQYHATMALEALEAGKHVIIQKPFALKVSDARKVLSVAHNKGLGLQVISTHRYLDKSLKIKERLNKGDLGKPRMAKLTLTGTFFSYPEGSIYRRKESGGQFIHNGMHYVDYLSWLLDSTPRRVFGMSRSWYPTENRLETDNYVLGYIEMENGALAVCELNLMDCNNVGPLKEKLLIVCDKGHIIDDNFPSPLFTQTCEGFKTIEQPRDDAVRSFIRLYEDFYQSLEGKQQPLPPEHSLKVFEAIIATMLSSHTGKWINIPMPVGMELIK